MIASILNETSVSQRDAARLGKHSVRHLVTYFTTHDQSKLTSLLKLVATSGYEPLTRRAATVIRKIASLNALNYVRLEEMGLLVRKPIKVKDASRQGKKA